MKITKYVHSCLLVETPDRLAIFDPGSMSEAALDVDGLDRLDDIFITHVHADHFSLDLVKRLHQKFPNVRITSTPEVVAQLAEASIQASDQPPAGVQFFDAPHESVAPLFGRPPQEIGIHYLDSLTHPGDSHSFRETKQILALPVQAPWGSTIKAINLALELKPRHILPIHDWHWSDAAREQSYNMMAELFGQHDITFHKLATGQPVEIEVGAKVAA
ncbi:MAG TPA: MBL fold metallo-hydrolase [Candidatus Saccharimonadales bacterium]|nr:MBL fold metallo-hydrolase [Candidatus Saccharimonadales bacterium]